MKRQNTRERERGGRQLEIARSSDPPAPDIILVSTLPHKNKKLQRQRERDNGGTNNEGRDRQGD